MPDTTPTEPAKPTEEQIKEADEAQDAKWQGDFKEEDLKVPYKREEEDGKDDKDVATDGDESKDDKTIDEDGSEEETYSEPAPIVTVQDPGEYTPADYSFETTLADGKSVKITTPEEAEKLSEDPENFKTPKQLLDFITRTTSMRNKLERDKQKWQDQKNSFDQQVDLQNQRREEIESIAKEIEYLESKGKLPEVAAEFKADGVNWNDPKVAKQPGVKEQVALLNYMSKENELRRQAGIKPFGPVDALTAMQSDEAEKIKIAESKAAGEARKAAGAKVAGVSPTQTGAYVPKGIAVGNPNVLKRGAAVWDN